MKTSLTRHTLTIGIEEEFFIVDAESGELASSDWLTDLSKDLHEPTIDVTPEIFRSMIEVRTAPHQALADLLRQQEQNRYLLTKRLLPQGKALLACGTHPTANWRGSAYGPQERYVQLLAGYGLSIERALTCGLHIHFGFADTQVLVRAFNNIRPYLPFIAAVSASSPFWQGRNARVKSYRRAVFDALPRSGTPPHMETLTDYLVFCASIHDPRYLSDGTTIWWDARINLRHSTLEIRVPDALPDIRRAQATVLFSAICVELALSQHPMKMRDQFINENRWSATRFGLNATMFCGEKAYRRGLENCINDIIQTETANEIIESAEWSAKNLKSSLLKIGEYHIENNIEDGMEHLSAARDFLKQALHLTGAVAMMNHLVNDSRHRTDIRTSA